MDIARGQFYLRFVQPEGAPKEVFAAFFHDCERLKFELEAQLREHHEMAHVEHEPENGAEAFKIECVEPKGEELLALLKQTVKRFGLEEKYKGLKVERMAAF